MSRSAVLAMALLLVLVAYAAAGESKDASLIEEYIRQRTHGEYKLTKISESDPLYRITATLSNKSKDEDYRYSEEDAKKVERAMRAKYKNQAKKVERKLVGSAVIVDYECDGPVAFITGQAPITGWRNEHRLFWIIDGQVSDGSQFALAKQLKEFIGTKMVNPYAPRKHGERRK